MAREGTAGLFAALLRYWRGRRGLSQLDLALAANVSARHVSFLETGRAKPSEEMLGRLAATLDIPLRAQNEMLEAAGFPRRFEEPTLEALLAGPVGGAVDRMLAHHEPYPMIVMNDRYDVLRLNAAAGSVLGAFVADTDALGEDVNVMETLFDPRLLRPHVVEWPRIARVMVSRLQREVLQRPDDAELAAVLERVLGHPGVPASWRQPDLAQPPEPALALRLERDHLSLALLSTVTVFSAPTNVTLQELQIESYFPLDDASDAVCRQLASAASS